MSYMKDVYSDICELYARGFKTLTIASMVDQPEELVEDAIKLYQEEYDEAFPTTLPIQQ